MSKLPPKFYWNKKKGKMMKKPNKSALKSMGLVKKSCKCGRGFWTRISEQTLCEKCIRDYKNTWYHSKYRNKKNTNTYKDDLVVKSNTVWPKELF